MFTMLLLLTTLAQSPGRVIATYDKDSDATCVQTKIGDLRAGGEMFTVSLASGFKGKGPAEKMATNVSLIVDRTGSRLLLEPDHKIEVTCDGQNIEHGPTSYSVLELPAKDRHCELASVTITREDMAKWIGKNRDIKVKVGKFETVSLRITERARMARFLRFLDSYPLAH